MNNGVKRILFFLYKSGYSNSNVSGKIVPINRVAGIKKYSLVR